MGDKIPHAIMSGELTIGDFVLKTHVLDDGTRIFEEESVIGFFEWLENGGMLTKEDAEKIAGFVHGVEIV